MAHRPDGQAVMKADTHADASRLFSCTPACIGLDPRRESLPPALGAAAATTPLDLATIFTRFCRDVIDVVAPLVPIVKPQLACFEALGPHGMTALADVIAYAHEKHLLVLADGKRGDIGSTAEAYADGWLAGPWAADALTVNPYLGLDSIEPFVKTATERKAGIFVLVKTSNPGSKDFQDITADGRTIYEHVAAGVEQMAARTGCGRARRVSRRRTRGARRQRPRRDLRPRAARDEHGARGEPVADSRRPSLPRHDRPPRRRNPRLQTSRSLGLEAHVSRANSREISGSSCFLRLTTFSSA
jgi:orotidine 5'-phosphate decarboxylase subfamily 2